MTQPVLYLLDTNMLSHLMRDTRGVVAQRYVARLRHDTPCRMAVSVVVHCELLYGLGKKPSPRLQAAYALQLQDMPVLPLDESVASQYANVRASMERAGTPLGPNDTLIAAHALALDAVLVSADRAFARVAGLTVENWLE